MDSFITIILANDDRLASSYFSVIDNETVICRNIRLLQSDNTVVISDYRNRICPEDHVSIIPTIHKGTLREVWLNVKDYSFKSCRVFYGHVVLSNRMLLSIRQDKRKTGLYGNYQKIFGFVLHKDRKEQFLDWSLNEWRKHPEADLSSVINFTHSRLILSKDYSDEYNPNIEMEVLLDGQHKRNHVV